MPAALSKSIVPALSAREQALATLDDATVKRLILEVKQRKCLWDEEDLKYTNDDRKTAWDEVHKELQCYRDVARNKWRTLQRQMKRAMKASHSIEERSKQFPYYKQMLFMEDKVMADIIIERQKENAMLQAPSQPTPFAVTPKSSAPLLSDEKSVHLVHQQTVQQQQAGQVGLSDEEFLASTEYFVSQIEQRDKIAFRTDVLKLVRYHRYKKNRA